MRKALSKCIIFLLLTQCLLSPFFSNTFAESESESSAVCSATPQTMNNYLTFQNEIIKLISTNSFKTATETMAEGKGGLFTNELLKIKWYNSTIDDTLAGQALRLFDITASRSLVGTITAVFLFELTAMAAIVDSSLNLTILLQDRPIVRDRSSLMDIEWELSSAAYSRWSAWDIQKTIVEMDQLNNILEAAKRSETITKDSSFWSSITYINLISELVDLNISVRLFLAYWSTKDLSRTERTDWKWKKHPRLIKFNEKWIEEIKEDYHPVRRTMWFKCNTSRKNLVKVMKQLWGSTAEQWKSSWKRISKSYKDLKEALTNRWGALNNLKWKSSSSKLTEREKEILRSRYGIDTSKITDQEWLSIFKLYTNWKNQSSAIKKGAKSINKENIKGVGKSIKEGIKNGWKNTKDALKDGRKKTKALVKATWTSIKSVFKRENNLSTLDAEFESWKNTMYSNGLFEQEMQKQIKSFTIFSEAFNKLTDDNPAIETTKEFSVIRFQINEILHTIWDKDSMLRKALYEVCSKQCTNRGSSCCYVQ